MNLREEPSKMRWEMPKLINLDINEATQTSGDGPSTFDGGAFVNDYNT